MSRVVMMDTDSYSMVGSDGTETNSMQCDVQNGEWDECRQPTTPISTAVALPSMTSVYAPAEMENALRVMTHAGRILWRAAMEAIPGGAGSYNPSISVLSKLWKLSFGKTKANSKTKNMMSVFSFAKPETALADEKTAIMTDEGGEEHFDVVQTIQNCMDDSYSPIEVRDEKGDNFESQPKKRKLISRISSLLPSVVSDSEEEEEDNDRPSKRIRRSFENEPAVYHW